MEFHVNLILNENNVLLLLHVCIAPFSYYFYMHLSPIYCVFKSTNDR